MTDLQPPAGPVGNQRSQVLVCAAASVLSLIVLIVAGSWLLSSIQSSMVRVYAETTAAAMSKSVADALEHVSDSDTPDASSESQARELEEFVASSVLSEQVLRIKVWSSEGTVLFSNDPALIDRRFKVKPLLARAIAGDTVWSVIETGSGENSSESARFGRVLEIYAPLPDRGSDGASPAAFEIYVTTLPVDAEIDGMRSRAALALAAVLAAQLIVIAFVGWRAAPAEPVLAEAVSDKEGANGLGSPDALAELLRAETLRALRYGRPLSILLIEDTGEDDEAAASMIKAILGDQLRDSDSFAPYPGGGVLVILPEATASVAADVAGRILEDSKETAGRDVCIGVADIPGCAQEYRSLLGAAETALGRARAAGGAGIVYYGAPT